MDQLRKYGVQTDFYFPLVMAGSQNFAVGADYTHASGDAKISKNGGAAATCTNSPSAITMGNGAVWKLTLTATEMQAALIVVTLIDATTKAVEDQAILISTYGHASAQHPFDLATATQSVSVASIAANAITTAAINDGAITAPKIATDAITAAKIATDAISATKIAAGAITSAKFAAGALDAVWSVATRTLTAFGFSVTASTVTDKTGYALSTAGVQAVWDALTSALTTASSIGKLLVDNVNATISSRLASASYSAADNASITAIKNKTDNLPASPSAVGDIPTSVQIRQEMDASSTQLIAIVADTSELQSDWVDAGRLDVILDAVKAKTDNLPSDPADASDVAASIAALNDISVADILAGTVENTLDVQESLRLMLSVLAGKSSGGSTTNVIFRDTADTVNRVDATVDANGNRTAITLDPS